MDKLLSNQWTVALVAGTLSSIIGGIILAAIKSGHMSEVRLPHRLGSFMETVSLLALYGVIMAICTMMIIKMVILFAASKNSIFAPIAPIIGIGLFIFAATGLFSSMILGKNPFDRFGE